MPGAFCLNAGLRATMTVDFAYNLSSLALTPGEPTPYVCMYVSMVHTHMWYVRGYVLGEEGVNASTSRGRNSKLEG